MVFDKFKIVEGKTVTLAFSCSKYFKIVCILCEANTFPMLKFDLFTEYLSRTGVEKVKMFNAFIATNYASKLSSFDSRLRIVHGTVFYCNVLDYY
jgi:hypothetical protein